MKNLYKYLAFSVAISLCGCVKAAPECGSKEVIDAINEKAMNGVVNYWSPQTNEEKVRSSFTFELKNIRTQDINKENGARLCAAEFHMNSTYGALLSDVKQIRYMVENLDDGKNFIVTIEKFKSYIFPKGSP